MTQSSADIDYISEDTLQATKDCPVCGWAADSIHTEVHHDRCRQWRAACEDMQYWPSVREEVRASLQDAQDRQKAATTDMERFDADFDLVAAYFDRSLGAAIDEGKHHEHPSFDSYASMVDLRSLGRIYREKYPLNEGVIAQGFTLWHPENSRERRAQFRLAKRRAQNS